jgi:hypothetical protein
LMGMYPHRPTGEYRLLLQTALVGKKVAAMSTRWVLTSRRGTSGNKRWWRWGG